MAEGQEVQRNRQEARELLANRAAQIGLIGTFIFSTGRSIYYNRRMFVDVARFISTQIVTFAKFVYHHINLPPYLIPNIVNYPVNIRRMSRSRLQAIESGIVHEPWAEGREIVVNQETNTISVFDIGDEDCQIQRHPVPLFYDEIPIIPHPYPYRSSDLLPKELNTSLNKVQDGLTRRQLQKFREYFVGLITVDYYLDKHIAITIPRQWYDAGISKSAGQDFGHGAVLSFSFAWSRSKILRLFTILKIVNQLFRRISYPDLEFTTKTANILQSAHSSTNALNFPRPLITQLFLLTWIILLFPRIRSSRRYMPELV